VPATQGMCGHASRPRVGEDRGADVTERSHGFAAVQRLQTLVTFFRDRMVSVTCAQGILDHPQLGIAITGARLMTRRAILANAAGDNLVEADRGKAAVLIADGPSQSSQYHTALRRGIPMVTEG
jgi:hypothetical protein